MISDQYVGSSEPREVAVGKYFTKTPSQPTYVVSITLGVFAVLGAVAVLIFLGSAMSAKDDLSQACSSCMFVLILGVVIICAGIAVTNYVVIRGRFVAAWAKAEPKPSDAQIDAWHANDLEKLREYALKKLDLSPEQVAQDNPGGPLMVEGPGPSPSVKAGADRVIRFSVHDILIVYLTKYHLASYTCTINLATGLVTSETTQEYHYNDVVSVSTQTDNSGLTWYVEGEKRQIPSYQKFALSVASGEQISVAIRPATTEIMGGNEMPESGSDKTIRAIRTRLREKKGGAMDGGKGADASML